MSLDLVFQVSLKPFGGALLFISIALERFHVLSLSFINVVYMYECISNLSFLMIKSFIAHIDGWNSIFVRISYGSLSMKYWWV